MIEITTNKPLVEAVTPNQDAVRDSVNPQAGLRDLGDALGKATQFLEGIRRDNAFATANTRYTELSFKAVQDFHDFTNSLDTRDSLQAGDKIKEYVDGRIRSAYDRFLSSISHRDVRKKFQAQVEHDIRDYHTKGVDIQIGATQRAQEDNLNMTVGLAAAHVLHDPSNENYFQRVQSITDHIDSLPIDLRLKQKLLSEAKEKLNTNQIIGAHKRNPQVFENFIRAFYKKGHTPKDSTSLSDVSSSARERSLEIVEDVSKSIGLAGWDRLDDTKRRHLLEHLLSRDNALNTKLRTKTQAQARRIDAQLNQGITVKPSELISLEDYTQAYGVDQGTELYNLQQLKFAAAPDVARIKLMSTSEAKEFFQKVDDDYASNPSLSLASTIMATKYKEMLEKSHRQSMKELNQDAISWGIKHKQIDPLRFDTEESFADSLSQRAGFVKKIKDDHNLTTSHFNKTEENQLRTQLVKRPTSEAVDLIRGAYNTLSDSDKEGVRSSFAHIEDNGLSAVVRLSSEFSDDAKNASMVVLDGMKHKKDIETRYNTDHKSNKFDTLYASYINKPLTNLERSTVGGDFIKDKEAIKLYILGDMEKYRQLHP
ncbi:hypothetical protein PSGCA5_05 [Liberibacter phage SGCA5-1]|uniref:Uncharacterized protein n=1 Tax=Liberibacter phage SGCA5-1 TaxID=1903184 RepID=A0A1L2JXW9_9CAUD|nr:hypothetical protein PSGCA5_05 [Liberibacter phage SGCA5-1]